jgi:hypothetical protein
LTARAPFQEPSRRFCFFFLILFDWHKKPSELLSDKFPNPLKISQHGSRSERGHIICVIINYMRTTLSHNRPNFGPKSEKSSMICSEVIYMIYAEVQARRRMTARLLAVEQVAAEYAEEALVYKALADYLNHSVGKSLDDELAGEEFGTYFRGRYPDRPNTVVQYVARVRAKTATAQRTATKAAERRARREAEKAEQAQIIAIGKEALRRQAGGVDVSAGRQVGQSQNQDQGEPDSF